MAQINHSNRDQVVKIGSLYPYWEIRDQANCLIMAKKPKETDSWFDSKAKVSHQNAEDLDLESALDNVINIFKGNAQAIIVKLAQAPTANKTFAFYAIPLVDDNGDENEPFAYFNQNNQQQQGVNGFAFNPYAPNSKFNKSESNPNIHDYIDKTISGLEEKYNTRLEGAIKDLDYRYKELMLNEKIKAFEAEKEKFEEEKEALKDKLEDKSLNWNKVADKAPEILSGIMGYIELFRPKTAESSLAGKIEQKPEIKKETTKKEPTMSFKKAGTSTEEAPANDTPKDAFSGIDGEVTEEEKKALAKALTAIKEGKLSVDELNEFSDNPADFFETDSLSVNNEESQENLDNSQAN